jgi:pathogenesis-related protein 1
MRTAISPAFSATRTLCLILCFAAAATSWFGCSGDDDGDPVVAARGGNAGTSAAAEPLELKGITQMHNVERRKVGVPDLTWDPALAAIAQAWASKCEDKDAPMGLVDHNPNRGVGYQGSVGENIFGSSATASSEQAVSSWVAELNSYDYAKNSCSGVCGHYTQVVWKTTTKVGCAIYKCAGLKYGGTLVCDYSPAGNVNGQRPY